MKRALTFVTMLVVLATGVALGDDEAPRPESPAGAAEAPVAAPAAAPATDAGAVEVEAHVPEGESDSVVRTSGAKAKEGADGAEPVAGTPEDREPGKTGAKVISGMSILGNQEAPTSLVIVPWKSSRIGESVGISTMLDDSRQPVDREVFLRSLAYYEIRSETTP